jgi:uncharacterized membrane protein
MKPLSNYMSGLFRIGSMPASRIESFSDNVFAFTVTLLVLEIRVPVVHGPDISAELAQGLTAMTPKFLVYILSFLLVCIWWVAHHQLFYVIRKADRGLLWLNCLFLLWLTVIPFPTALMGDYPHERIAVMCYGMATTLAGMSFCLMRYYAFYAARLVDETIDSRLLKEAMLKSILNPVLHFLAVLLALVDTRLTLALYVALPLLFFVPSKLDRHVSSEHL